jgi:sugar phosphate isomerase/epimerase
MSIKTALYSISYLGVWYKGEALDWKGVCDRAKKFGYDGVEFDAKRPHANPIDWCENTRKAVVDYAGSLGLTLPAVSANNDFSSPIDEHRESQILMVKEQLRLCRDLGSPVLRVFAAWPGITFHKDGIASYDAARRNWNLYFADVPFLERWQYVKDCLIECCKYAEEYGVTMALQNHAPVLSTWEDMRNMIGEINSPWLKACFDFNPTCDNIEAIKAGWKAMGRDGSIHNHFNGEFVRLPDGSVGVKEDIYFGERHYNQVHYKEFYQEMKKTGYSGYVAYEFCHIPLINSVAQGIEMVDEQCALALEYVKDILK